MTGNSKYIPKLFKKKIKRTNLIGSGLSKNDKMYINNFFANKIKLFGKKNALF